MTEYRIFLADGRSTDLSAAKVYFGWKRFYLYDEQSNVVGSFVWEQLSGFQVISQPVQQFILQEDDELPHNRKPKSEDREAALKKQKGEYLYELEVAAEQLKQASSKLRSAWLIAGTYRRSKASELAVLLQHSKGEVQQVQATLADTQKEIDGTVTDLLTQIGRGLKGDSSF